MSMGLNSISYSGANALQLNLNQIFIILEVLRRSMLRVVGVSPRLNALCKEAAPKKRRIGGSC